MTSLRDRDGIRLGRFLGINLILDFSWLFIFLLMTWNLTAYFASLHPGWSLATRAASALAGSLLFFASVVAHEYGHAMVAKRFGLSVREIRLFLFGGVSNIEREPPSPEAELLIAIAGPMVSFAIGIAMLIVSGFLLLFTNPLASLDVEEALRRLSPPLSILVWLGPLNLTLGLFNLIPSFPLDGGRVLRAILWKSSGNLEQATRWASAVGQIIGWGFIVMGVAMFFGVQIPVFGRGTGGGGVWFALIGWFLLRSAAMDPHDHRQRSANAR